MKIITKKDNKGKNKKYLRESNETDYDQEHYEILRDSFAEQIDLMAIEKEKAEDKIRLFNK